MAIPDDEAGMRIVACVSCGNDRPSVVELKIVLRHEGAGLYGAGPLRISGQAPSNLERQGGLSGLKAR